MYALFSRGFRDLFQKIRANKASCSTWARTNTSFNTNSRMLRYKPTLARPGLGSLQRSPSRLTFQ